MTTNSIIAICAYWFIILIVTWCWRTLDGTLLLVSVSLYCCLDIFFSFLEFSVLPVFLQGTLDWFQVYQMSTEKGKKWRKHLHFSPFTKCLTKFRYFPAFHFLFIFTLPSAAVVISTVWKAFFPMFAMSKDWISLNFKVPNNFASYSLCLRYLLYIFLNIIPFSEHPGR